MTDLKSFFRKPGLSRKLGQTSHALIPHYIGSNSYVVYSPGMYPLAMYSPAMYSLTTCPFIIPAQPICTALLRILNKEATHSACKKLI